jgi:hypothetical protein
MGKHSIDSDKPLINMTLTPSAVSYNVPINTPFKVKPYKRLSRFIWWLVPLVPLVVVTIVFNEVIQNMAVDYFKSFS